MMTINNELFQWLAMALTGIWNMISSFLIWGIYCQTPLMLLLACSAFQQCWCWAMQTKIVCQPFIMSVLDNLVSLFVCLFFQVDTVVALYIFLNNNNTSPLLFETSKLSKMRLLHISNRSSGCSICIFIPWL